MRYRTNAATLMNIVDAANWRKENTISPNLVLGAQIFAKK